MEQDGKKIGRGQEHSLEWVELEWVEPLCTARKVEQLAGEDSDCSSLQVAAPSKNMGAPWD